jgi:CO/xanthine dehydrogenase FAD-binding subunit
MSMSAANFAVALEPDGEAVKNVRIATGCLGPFPRRAPMTEAYIEGKPLSEEVLSQIDEVLTQGDIQPHSGLRASEEYRRLVAPVFISRLLRSAHGIGEV